jgi:hypothetical protein
MQLNQSENGSAQQEWHQAGTGRERFKTNRRPEKYRTRVDSASIRHLRRGARRGSTKPGQEVGNYGRVRFLNLAISERFKRYTLAQIYPALRERSVA